MDFSFIEKSFNRALSFSFSKIKILLAFPLLSLCGLLFIFCRALAEDQIGWVRLSLLFLPILLSMGILLSLGVLLVRVYHHEVKQLKVEIKSLLFSSFELLIGTSYLSVPLLLFYLFFWVLLGAFMLLRELPYVGEFFGVILAFAPFLLILASLLLCILSLLLLFFAAPSIAFKKAESLMVVKELFAQIKENIFRNLLLFMIALLPMGLSLFVLSFAWELTSQHYLLMEHLLTKTLSAFFIMLPFALFLTPSLLFFFSFAAESYNAFFLRKGQESST